MTPGLVKIDQGKARLNDTLGKFERKGQSAFNRVSGKVDMFKAKNDKAFSLITKAAPGVTRALGAFVNPITVGAAAALALGKGLAAAVQQAERFNDTFLELQNLNLDKTDAQIKQLSNSVLTTSKDAKQGVNETSRAFFDVQSITGQYGEEVEQLVGKVGRFSRAFKADFNTQVEASTVATQAFGLRLSEVDRVLESNVKTVQVGKVTFEQLARVQTDFAGAATKSFQSVDSANKLFAVFTQKAKSAEEAATLTKSAFQDLFKESTLKAFKDTLGVDLFDADGQAKQIDQIVSEASAAFSKLGEDSPQKLNKLVNQFKGNEGLIALINAAAFQGEDLKRTFDSFDNTNVSIDKAIGNANKNLATLKQDLANIRDRILTRIGNKILPLITSGFSKIVSFAEKVDSNLDFILNKSELFKDIVSGIGFLLRNTVGVGFRIIKAVVSETLDLVGGLFSKLENIYRSIKRFIQDVVFRGKAAFEAIKKFRKGDLTGASNSFDDVINGKPRPEPRPDLPLPGLPPPNPNFKLPFSVDPVSQTKTKETTEKKLQDKVNSVVGQSKSRNITVNITSLVKELNINTQTLQQGSARVQDELVKALTAAVRQTEQTLSTD